MSTPTKHSVVYEGTNMTLQEMKKAVRAFRRKNKTGVFFPVRWKIEDGKIVRPKEFVFPAEVLLAQLKDPTRKRRTPTNTENGL